MGFGLETDLRRTAAGQFYISHDPGELTDFNRLEAYEALFRNYPDRVVAMNVKELGYEEELIRLSNQGSLGTHAFYFDFELLELRTPGDAQKKLKSLPGGERVPVASRLSDRGESLEQCLAIVAEVVWADEFDSLWISKQEVEAVRESGRKLYMISPELHGFDRDSVLKRWADFREWGVDGICTDYALEAQAFFQRG